jgi:hypothetical protein
MTIIKKILRQITCREGEILPMLTQICGNLPYTTGAFFRIRINKPAFIRLTGTGDNGTGVAIELGR